MNKESVLLIVALIWGIYSIVVGILAILHGYSNNLVWISIIGAISGTTGAHIAISMSQKGLKISTSGPSQTSSESQKT